MADVVDASVAAKWLLRDERSKAADELSSRFAHDGAVVPGIFTFEVENILIVAERRGRIDRAEIGDALDLLRTLDLQVDSCTLSARGRDVDLARRYALSAYDGAYLGLASRRGVALCTADARLAAAARREKVATILVA